MVFAGIGSDPFISWFSNWNPNALPEVMTVTSLRRRKRHTVFARSWRIFSSGDGFMGKKGRGFETGRIAGWVADRGYQKVLVMIKV